MCGRYDWFMNMENKEMKYIVEQVQQNFPEEVLKNGEVFPTNKAPVLAMSKEKKLFVQLPAWGLHKYQGSGVIINARSETIQEKPMFQKLFLTSRCAVVSTGFFEWAQDGRKYKFNLPGQEILYLAGLLSIQNGEQRFVILTRAANESMRDIHNRMPVLFSKEGVRNWVFDKNSAMEVLERPGPFLERKPVSKQISLFE